MPTEDRRRRKEVIPLSTLFQKHTERFSEARAKDPEETMPISFRKKSQSSRDDKNEEMPGDDGSGLGISNLAKIYFQTAAPPSYSRKEIRHPLLKGTQESDKQVALNINKVILKFMGDSTDYRVNQTNPNTQSNLGPVMTRLYLQLSAGSRANKLRLMPNIEEELNEGEAPTKKPSKPPRGTLRRLRATLHSRMGLFPEQVAEFNEQPMEGTLATPLDQIHYITGNGILRTKLRDEIYCQIIKQLIDNSNKSGLSRGWLLLALVAGSFVPSPEIFPYVMHFVKEGPAYYATSLPKLLERTQKNGTRFQPPAYIELEAALLKKPVELTVTLMDGTDHAVAIDSAMTSKELCEKLSRLIVLHQHQGFAVYMAFNNKIASLGAGSDHVLDSVSQCEQTFREQEGEGKEAYANWRLFFRKEVIIPWEDAQDDYVAINLIFAQVVRGIILGEFLCDTDTELALVAAQQYYIEYGGKISEEALQAVLPSYVPPDKRESSQTNDPLKYWRKLVIKIYNKLYGSKDDQDRPDTQRVKLDIVRFAKGKWQQEFSRFYEATRLEGPTWNDNNVMVGVSGGGLVVMSAEMVKLMDFTYAEIYQISGEKETDDAPAHVVTFLLATGKLLKLESVDAEEILRSVTTMLEGLRQRSRWAVARQDYRGKSAEELTFKEGDLVVLQQRAREAALTEPFCKAQNKRTGQFGELATDKLFIVPTVTEPGEDTLKLFRNKAKRLTVPPPDMLIGTIISLNKGDEVRSKYEWKDNALAQVPGEKAGVKVDLRPAPVQPPPSTQTNGESNDFGTRDTDSGHGSSVRESDTPNVSLIIDDEQVTKYEKNNLKPNENENKQSVYQRHDRSPATHIVNGRKTGSTDIISTNTDNYVTIEDETTTTEITDDLSENHTHQDKIVSNGHVPELTVVHFDIAL